MTPKRIVHCANFNTIRLKGCYMASMGYKLTQGLIRLNHQVLCYSDRDVAKAFGFLGHKNFLGNQKANENFYKYCINLKPDVILLGHADTISTETLKKIKEELKDVKIVQWNVDPVNPIEPSCINNIKNLKSKLEVVDYTFITTADSRLLSVLDLEKNKVFFIPNPVDASIETAKVYESINPKYDLFFAASPNSKRDLGGKIITSKELTEIITNNVKSDKLLFPRLNSPSLDGVSYLEGLANSAMVLNISRLSNDYLYSSDRMAHAIGQGCLTFVDRKTGFGDIFTEDEIAFYETKEELLEKINYYIENPKQRQIVAQNGYKKYHELFNETKVAKYLMSVVDGSFNEKDYPYKTLIK